MPLPKVKQEICRQLILANELVVHSEDLKGEELKETLREAREHAKSALDMLYPLTDDLLKANVTCSTLEGKSHTFKSIAISYDEIKAILKKYPNRRVHVAISKLLGEDVYNKIKEEL